MRLRIKSAFIIALGTMAAAGLAGAAETVTYSYDAQGRLKLVQRTNASSNNMIANYSYDAADNRKSVKVTGAP